MDVLYAPNSVGFIPLEYEGIYAFSPNKPTHAHWEQTLGALLPM